MVGTPLDGNAKLLRSPASIGAAGTGFPEHPRG